jgi:hypothetical protein
MANGAKNVTAVPLRLEPVIVPLGPFRPSELPRRRNPNHINRPVAVTVLSPANILVAFLFASTLLVQTAAQSSCSSADLEAAQEAATSPPCEVGKNHFEHRGRGQRYHPSKRICEDCPWGYRGLGGTSPTCQDASQDDGTGQSPWNRYFITCDYRDYYGTSASWLCGCSAKNNCEYTT